jgi:hypothetical protein
MHSRAAADRLSNRSVIDMVVSDTRIRFASARAVKSGLESSIRFQRTARCSGQSRVGVRFVFAVRDSALLTRCLNGAVMTISPLALAGS